MIFKLGYSIIAGNLLDSITICQQLDFVDFFHFDIMDGNFVPNITFGPTYVNNFIGKINNKKFIDVHLMVNNPEKYIDSLKQVDQIIFHIENLSDQTILNIINNIKKNKIKCGLSLSPTTDIQTIIKYLDKVDLIQIMTVEPGKCGQHLIPNCLEKIKFIRKNRPTIDIQVDGGIKLNNIKDVIESGANSFICGSSMIKDGLSIKKTLI
jgi:ribulose-phosphate 3-epimerase